MKKIIFAFLVLILLISCVPYESSYTEPQKFVSNIPEVFWGNWIVDNKEFINTMHFDIEKEHIWQWVENFEDDKQNDITNTGFNSEDVTEGSFNSSAYNPPFGNIGYKQRYFNYTYKDDRSSTYILMLFYDSTKDKIKLWMYHSASYKTPTEFTYYLERMSNNGK